MLRLTCSDDQHLQPIYVWSEGTSSNGPLGDMVAVTTLKVYQPRQGQPPPEITQSFKDDFGPDSLTLFHFYNGTWIDMAAPSSEMNARIVEFTLTTGKLREDLGGPHKVPFVVHWSVVLASQFSFSLTQNVLK